MKAKNRLLIICGPTACGKTSLASDIAEKFNGQVISADSRQVYKYMDIGTGKEKPKNQNILGYDLVSPNQEFSVKNYVDFATKAIEQIYKERKLPILTGGTGLYIKAIVDDMDRINIPRNVVLRKQLAGKTATELLAILMKHSPAEALRLNSSDRANPTRLVRSIEIFSVKQVPPATTIEKTKFDDILWIGLTTNKEELQKRIEKRVDDRLSEGFERELETLAKKNLLKDVATKTLGYEQFIKYPKEEAIKKWKIAEVKYAKRQMTWFKKEKKIVWFDISSSDWKSSVEDMFRKWYDNANAAKS